MAMKDNLKVGKATTHHEAPSHTPGVKAGNAIGGYEKSAGHLPNWRSTAERSTGVNSGAAGPIDPSMPNLSPA